MDILTGKLDNVFQSEISLQTYSKFINYKRNDDEDISAYILEYEHLHKRMTDFNISRSE